MNPNVQRFLWFRLERGPGVCPGCGGPATVDVGMTMFTRDEPSGVLATVECPDCGWRVL